MKVRTLMRDIPSGPFVVGNTPQRSVPLHDEDFIDSPALFGTIWRGKFIIALITALAVLAGAYYASALATPLYQASAVVILQTQQGNVVDLQGVVGGLTGDTAEVNSEVEVLRARGLMGKVVDRLDLTRDAEYNEWLQPAGPLDRAISRITGTAPEPHIITPERQRDATISRLLDAVTIHNIPLSLVFRVTVETTDPVKSALIADTIVELYILNQLEVKFQATEQATAWLSDRVAELQQELESAEAELAAFNTSTQLVSVVSLQALERQLKDLRDRIVSAENALAASQTRLSQLQSGGTRADRAAVAGDTQLSGLLSRTETDPGIATAFDTRFEQIIDQLSFDQARSEQQIIALRGSETSLQDQISQQGQELIILQQLTREAEATRLLYEYFLTRLKETSAQQGIQQADSRILSDAVVPGRASFPQKSLILGMAGTMGLLAGIVVVLLREAAASGFRSGRALETVTGYAVLGQVPLIPGRNRKRILTYLSEKPASSAAEAIRNLRTSVLLSNIDQPPQVIVSTSSVPHEGKTTNSIALAQNLGSMGRKVLLIEGDIRRRTLHEYFDGLPEKGIVALLSGDITLDDAVHRDPQLNGDLLIGEQTSINAADLFASERFKALITTLRDRYDTIIIDTPPVLIVPDARIIAQHADAVLFTVKWDSTSREQVAEGLDMFRGGRIRISGLVLSQINPRQMKQYGSRYGRSAALGAKYYRN